MTTVTTEQARQMRKAFRLMNRYLMIPMWRLGLYHWFGVWAEGFGKIMVITHTGRKTSQKRQSPVNFAEVDGALYCTAGFGEKTDWYRNILHNPQVEVWLPDGSWYAAVAEDASGDEKRLAILRQVMINSGFAARLFEGIDAKAISDEEIGALLETYRLVRIRRTAACTGPGGPGEFVWVWPLLVFLLLLRPRRKKIIRK
jgi:deazaflavin-dependent oxidoreductase (nitroreductase family)